MAAVSNSKKRLYIRPIEDQDFYTIHQSCVKYPAYFNAQKNYYHREKETNQCFHLIGQCPTTNLLIGSIKGYLLENFGTLWIQSILIFPEYLRQHFGTELFYGTLELLGQYYTINKIYLTILDHNITAQLFWQSLGFKNIYAIDKTLDQERIKATLYEKIL